jgi:hypothetical protein
MSEKVVIQLDDAKRLAVEAKVFKRLDKRREDNSALQAIRQTAREEQSAGTLAILAELDSWTSKMGSMMNQKIVDDSGDDIVGNTLFLDNLAEDMQKLDSYFAEKSAYLAAYDVKRIQNLILVTFFCLTYNFNSLPMPQ